MAVDLINHRIFTQGQGFESLGRHRLYLLFLDLVDLFHNFQFLVAIWLGLGNKITWLGLGKDHGLR